MPRPRLRRHVCINPEITYFKPRGVPLQHLEQIQLTHEEIEVVWLVDLKGYEQAATARHMRTSQSTVQRILVSARNKIADAIVNGKAIALTKHA